MKISFTLKVFSARRTPRDTIGIRKGDVGRPSKNCRAFYSAFYTTLQDKRYFTAYTGTVIDTDEEIWRSSRTTIDPPSRRGLEVIRRSGAISAEMKRKVHQFYPDLPRNSGVASRENRSLCKLGESPESRALALKNLSNFIPARDIRRAARAELHPAC